MKRIFLKSKLHNATITQADLTYEGSLSVDEALLEAADIQEYEQVQVYNVTQGTRFTTYAIKAARGSKTLCANGACAHLVNPGDRAIVCTYVALDNDALKTHQPVVLLLDEANNYRLKP